MGILAYCLPLDWELAKPGSIVMPVQPVIALEQIVIIVAFLMILLALMWFVRRNRGGIASRI